MSTNKFDEQLREKVLKQFQDTKGEELASAYENAQARLKLEVYENIKGKEPNLSDHGTVHISNVKQNVISLLSDDRGTMDLTGAEMYCLGMLILFHDAGNVFARKDHHNKVAEIFDSIRGTGSSARHEKTLVVRAARAHTGTARDGSNDTLKEVETLEQLGGHPVRLRELAAVLRFADELAEGPQRTSDFMQQMKLYRPDSTIFHDYASSTNILIDRKNGRIILTYEISIEVGGTEEDRRKHLSEFLDFIYKRIIKLNQERQYARYYTKLLDPFKLTEITFNFHCDGAILETDLMPLKLTDIVVPGDQTKAVVDRDPSYAIEGLVTDLLSKCPGENRHETGK